MRRLKIRTERENVYKIGDVWEKKQANIFNDITDNKLSKRRKEEEERPKTDKIRRDNNEKKN